MQLTHYEKQVLRRMLKSEYSISQIENIISNSSVNSYDYNGAGYFIEITNELFPNKRKVISEPLLNGTVEHYQLGFILYLENKSLILECHSWNDSNLPKEIRKKKVFID